MKRQGKLFNKLKRKVSAFTLAMLVLQPLLMVALAPVAKAASYEVSAATQNEGLDTTVGSFGSLKTNNNIGMHINSGEILYVDTFDADGIDENDIHDAVLKIKYKTEEEYTGTDVVKYAIEGLEASSTEIVPTLNDEYVIQSYNLFSQGVDTKQEIENLDVTFTNNSESGDESDEDVVIDYLWVEVETDEVPQATFINQPDVLTNLSNAEFEWEGQDDTTDPSSLEYSYRLDGGAWTDYFSDEDNTVDFIGLGDGLHIFDLRIKDEDLNQTTINYEWTIDATAPTFESTVTPDLANQNNKTVEIEVVPSEELKQRPATETLEGGKKVIALDTTYRVEVIFNKGTDNETTYRIDKDEDGKFILPYEIKESGDNVTITFDIKGTDLAGNESVDQTGSFTLDNVAPGKVTDLKATAGNSKIELTWENPTDSDFAGVKIVRTGSDGSSLTSTTLTTGEAYSDTTVTNGVTYTYDVYAVDNAGNESAKASVSATPAAPVAPAISSASTSRVTSAISTETFKPKVDEAGEVKAAEITADDKSDDQKDIEVKDEKKIPVWGILFLLILAAIGGYLFYVQNPENNGIRK